MRLAGGSGGLSYLGGELSRRAREPAGHFIFWVYLVFGTVGFGGFGIWVEWWRIAVSHPNASADSLHTALFTFFTALAGGSTLHLLFSDVKKPLLGFAVVYCVVLGGLACWQATRPSDELQAFGGAGVGCLLALAMWWLTSGQDEAFRDGVDPSIPVGGNTSGTPQGDLTGFTTS